jgi:hypothetical protein
VFDVIASAVTDYLLDRLPETRRGRIVLVAFMVATVALGIAALVVVLGG